MRNDLLGEGEINDEESIVAAFLLTLPFHSQIFAISPRSTPSRSEPVKKLIDVHRMITRQFFRALTAHFAARELGRKILKSSPRDLDWCCNVKGLSWFVLVLFMHAPSE